MIKNIQNIIFQAGLAAAVVGCLNFSILGQTDKTKASIAGGGGGVQTVDARQSGTWKVGIDQANNNVRVSNSPDDPVAVKVVQGGSKRPYQMSAGVDITIGGSGRLITVPVPAGKRFIIEHVSATTYRPAGLRMSIDVISYFDNGPDIDDSLDGALHGIALIEQGAVLGGQEVSSASHKVLIFADSRLGTVNTPMRVSFNLSGVVSTGFARGVVTFTGYLEDLPVNP